MRSRYRRRGARAIVVAPLAALILCVALGGCGGGSYSSKPTPAPTSASASSQPAGTATRITIDNFAFSPKTLRVKAGAKVTVSNMDSTTHTVTATNKSQFDTGNVAAGKTATFTAPSKPGSYPYTCTIHPFMKGTLTVQ